MVYTLRNYIKRILASTPRKIDKLLYSNGTAMCSAPINSFRVLGIESVNNGAVYQYVHLKPFPQIDSRSFTSIFSISNVSARATMFGGSSSESTTLSH